MDNIILGDELVARQAPLVFATNSGPTTLPTSLAAILASGVTSAGPVVGDATTVTLPPTGQPTISSVTVSTTPTPAPTGSQAASSGGPDNGSKTTLLIAILVPVCVVLAVVPTAAYLFYLRRRDRRQREKDEMMARGRRSNHSSSGATGEALLMRRSMSATSHHERKVASVASTELEMGIGSAVLEKSLSSHSHRQDQGIFAPVGHGPAGRRSPQNMGGAQPKPFKPRPDASASPTLPPLDFGKDDVSGLSSLSVPLSTSPPQNISPSKSSVPATLPTFAPSQPKQRAPNPALAPGRLNTPPSSSPADNPSWPLPAGGLRESSNSISSNGNERPYNSKPLPSTLNKELPPTNTSATAARLQQQQQQHGPRESSIAYGIPPVPPSPATEDEFIPERRSTSNRKRDSDAVSELSYSASTRGRRDPRRDTDAISVISAISQDR